MRSVQQVPLSCWAFVVLCLAAPAVSADDGRGVLRVDTPEFRIPVTFASGAQERIKELQLFASDDKGESWRQVDSIGADDKAFRFRATHEGEIWFSVRTVTNEGSAVPEDVSGLPATLKIRVGGEKPKPAGNPEREIRELKAEIDALRQRLRQIDKRLSEIEESKPE